MHTHAVVYSTLSRGLSRWFSEPANRALRTWLGTRMRLKALTGTLVTDPS